MSLLDEALEYRKTGFSLIPVAKDKRPLVKWEPYQKEIPSEEQIRAWWQAYPEANIGIITGEINDIVVLDCDNQETIDWFEENYTGNTPCVQTPKGRHYYFKYQEGIRNTVRIKGALDVRGSGGYIVAPPSSNGEGRPYIWLKNIKDFALDSLDSPFLSFDFFSLYKEVNDYNVKKSKEVNESQKKSIVYFTEGRRDEDMFHIANLLVRGYCEPDMTYQVLETIANNCNPPYPEKDIPVKIKSALDRVARKERNISQELRDWVQVNSGQFKVKDYQVESNIVKKEDKHTLIVALRNLCEQGLIKSTGIRTGEYRIVKKDIEVINWADADEDEYKIKYPLGIEYLAKTYPRNIILLAGASNTGKTAFMLETIRLNQDKRNIIYFNSEMGASELKLRLQMFKDICPMDKWKFKAIERSSNFADVIEPDALNIIDFMEIYKDFWEISGWIKDVHEKLKTGIAIIGAQKKASTKKDSNKFSRGGEMTLEKPRIYLAMDRGRIEIIKAKNWRQSTINPNGMARHFSLIGGWKFLPLNSEEWHQGDDEKYEGYGQRKDKDFIPEED